MERNDKNWSLVEAANKQLNPLEPLISFQKFTKKNLDLHLSCILGTSLDEGTMNWAFNLTKLNMEDLYEDSWGWNDKEKWRELKDDRIWFLVAYNDENHPVAFTSFRFDLDFGNPVVYCYEIQLNTKVQRKGLGKFMMQILQLLAIKNGMTKVVSTVLKCNNASGDFFMKKLRYELDETSPVDECYEILSKPVPAVRVS